MKMVLNRGAQDYIIHWLCSTEQIYLCIIFLYFFLVPNFTKHKYKYINTQQSYLRENNILNMLFHGLVYMHHDKGCTLLVHPSKD